MDSHDYDNMSGARRGPATRDGIELSTLNADVAPPIKGTSSLSAIKRKWIAITIIIGCVALIVGLALGAVGYKFIFCEG